MIKKLLAEKLSQKEFRARIEEMHAYDIALELLELSAEEREQLYRYLSVEQIAEIVTYLEPEIAAEVLASFDKEKQIQTLDEMTADDAIDILQAYEDETLRDEIVETLQDAEEVKELIKYDDENLVGAYISNDYVYLHPEMDVKEATTSLIKQAADAESINLLFVIDENDHYLGAVNLKTLVKARSPKKIEEIMITIPSVRYYLPITEAVYDMKNHELYELPVVDEREQLLGILTLDDIIDAAATEAEEDFEKLAALPSSDLKENWLLTALKRLPWLIVLLIISIPLMMFSDLMVASLAGITILAFFQPLMLAAPGNASTQTLAVSLKAIASQGKMSKSEVWKEFSANLFTSIFLGVITFIISFIFILVTRMGIPENAATWSNVEVALLFATIISTSLTIVIALVSLLAIALPHLFKKMKIDPAIASGPFITTVIDLASSLVYFGLAAVMLRGVGLI